MKRDVAELKRLAEEATPGPWTQWVEHGDVWSGVPERNSPGNMGGGSLGIRVCDCDADDYDGENDEEAEAQAKATAAYIAAANPQTILALIERLETLEEAVKGAHVIAEQVGDVLRANKGIVRLTLEQAKSLELAGTEDRSYGEKCWCPACGTGVPYEYDGDSWFVRPQPIPHREDCWLAAAIKEAQGE